MVFTRLRSLLFSGKGHFTVEENIYVGISCTASQQNSQFFFFPQMSNDSTVFAVVNVRNQFGSWHLKKKKGAAFYVLVLTLNMEF